MKITKDYLAKYKKMSDCAWHDACWHTFMDDSRSEALTYAFQNCDFDDTDNDIIKEAEKYLTSVK